MIQKPLHNFHIPVMGLAYTIDSPIRVAQYGISSVVSIIDDEIIEKMKNFYSKKFNLKYPSISTKIDDYRAKRITDYLDMMDDIVNEKFEAFKEEISKNKTSLKNFMEMLPSASELKSGFQNLLTKKDDFTSSVKIFIENHLSPGNIDVNIMTKVDKDNFHKNEQLPVMYNDAHASLRGFAKSKLSSSMVLSAGMNPRLYSYIEEFDDFFPDENGFLKKKIILKVSDFRSAMIQGNFLAKKGLWVSEYRIESGLNCGGHAFATEGLLLGPIMQEFKERKNELIDSAHSLMVKALEQKGKYTVVQPLEMKITVQGGVGTAEEHEFLLKTYEVNSVGWGSPFLLVPEATAMDNETRQLLAKSKENDFYLSNASPLGILFNNFRQSSMEKLRSLRLERDRPGSPCTKKYLVTNTEFTEQPICTASREYQRLKIKQLQASGVTDNEFREQYASITEKICLCEGLCTSAYIKLNILKPKENMAVAICPGPNIAYFDRTYTLDEMVGHIYGFTDLLSNVQRPHMFIKELNLYIDYLQCEVKKQLKNLNDKKEKNLIAFKKQVEDGINYYKAIVNKLPDQTAAFLQTWLEELSSSENKLKQIPI